MADAAADKRLEIEVMKAQSKELLEMANALAAEDRQPNKLAPSSVETAASTPAESEVKETPDE